MSATQVPNSNGHVTAAPATNTTAKRLGREVVRRKLVIVGDGACGKTSLLSVFTLGYFPKVTFSGFRSNTITIFGVLFAGFAALWKPILGRNTNGCGREKSAPLSEIGSNGHTPPSTHSHIYLLRNLYGVFDLHLLLLRKASKDIK